MRFAIRFVVVALLWVVVDVSAGFSQVCSIDFEATCPNSPPECNVTFSGGLGCRVAGLPGCYTSGARSYEVDANNALTITIPSGILRIDAFFAHSGGAQGTMTFFDATTGGSMVGNPLQTNGDCSAAMPPVQNQTFSSAVFRIEVDVSGGGSVWIDDLTLTDTTVSVSEGPWGHVKKLYRE
jgi:hypothetical protein